MKFLSISAKFVYVIPTLVWQISLVVCIDFPKYLLVFNIMNDCLQISGRGKQCRLLSTVGVARSIGDHDLLAKGCGIKVKEFLTPQPEVRIFDLKDMTLTGKIMSILQLFENQDRISLS